MGGTTKAKHSFSTVNQSKAHPVLFLSHKYTEYPCTTRQIRAHTHITGVCIQLPVQFQTLDFLDSFHTCVDKVTVLHATYNTSYFIPFTLNSPKQPPKLTFTHIIGVSHPNSVRRTSSSHFTLVRTT